MRKMAGLVALAALLGSALPTAAPAPNPAGAIPGAQVTGWVPYWRSADAKTNLAELDRIGGTEIMPFWYEALSATSVGIVGGATERTNLVSTVNTARSLGLKVIPSIVDGTGKFEMAAILADPAARAQHVAAIRQVVATGVNGIPYDGIDIDYEGFAFTDGVGTKNVQQPGWIDFVRELGAALHADGKLLSVTVPPIWDGGASGYRLYGPWSELMPHVDRLRLMVYDWSVPSPGPIAPMHWVQNVIAYVNQVIPQHKSKVWLGVPTYGRSWAVRRGGAPCPASAASLLTTRSVLARDAASLAASNGAAIVAAPGANVGERYFTWEQGTYSGSATVAPTPPPYVPQAQQVGEYELPADPTGLVPAQRIVPQAQNVTCTVDRVVYFPDTASVAQRATAAKNAGLGGIVIWAFGYETSDLWDAVAGA